MAIKTHIHIVPFKRRPSPTMSAGAAADEARTANRPLLTFTVGDIHDKPIAQEIESWQAKLAEAAKSAATPEEKARTAIEPNLYSYAKGLGTAGFRAAAAYKFSEETGMQVKADNIGVGTGAKGVLNTIGSNFQPGDEIIVAAPGWPTNYDFFTGGVHIIEVDTDGRGLLNPQQLQEALAAHPNAKGILINTPSNPTGEAYGYDEREEIMKVIAAHTAGKKPGDFLTMLDNPYGRIVFDGGPVKRSDTEKKLFDEGNIVEVRSMSKEYGLAGIRVGYAISRNADVIKHVGIWNETCAGLTSGEQNLAQAALLFGDEYVARNVADLKEKRDALVSGLQTLKYVDVASPSGAIYVFPDFRKLKGKTVPPELTLHPEKGEGFVIETPKDAQRYLIEAANIVAVPGVPFYAPRKAGDTPVDDWHFRLCYSGSIKDIEQAVENLRRAEQVIDKGFAQRRDNRPDVAARVAS